MKDVKVDSSRLRLAQVRYFNKEMNGVSIPSQSAYAFLVNVNGTYVNIVNPIEELPVYDRVPYTNTTLDGEDYGTKLVLINGEVQDGVCYVLERTKIEDLFDKKEVYISDLEDYIMKSDKFFIDRIDLLRDKIGSQRRKSYYRRKMVSDLKLLDKFNNYLAEESKGVQYKK